MCIRDSIKALAKPYNRIKRQKNRGRGGKIRICDPLFPKQRAFPTFLKEIFEILRTADGNNVASISIYLAAIVSIYRGCMLLTEVLGC